jgi:hypothetical protein
LRLIAKKISEDWPLGVMRGHVHSAHPRVLNIELGAAGLHSVMDERQLGEQARVAYVQIPLGLRFSDLVFSGQTVFLNSVSMMFERSTLSLDFGSAKAMNFFPENRPKEYTLNRACLASWLAAWNFLMKYDGPKGFISGSARQTFGMFNHAINTRFWTELPLLMCKMRLGKLKESVIVASSFRGLGMGCTPSGDDFLTGLLVGAGFLTCAARNQEFVQKFGKELVKGPWVENKLVGKFRLDAMAGHPSLVLCKLCSVLSAGATGLPLERAIREALACGSTSGWDTVLGLLSGFSIWCQEMSSEIEKYSALYVEQGQLKRAC